MYSDAAGTIPALTTDTTDGFAFTVGVNLRWVNHREQFLVANQRSAGNQWDPGAEQLGSVRNGARLVGSVTFPATATAGHSSLT